jgi:hypothetical protein
MTQNCIGLTQNHLGCSRAIPVDAALFVRPVTSGNRTLAIA